MNLLRRCEVTEDDLKSNKHGIISATQRETKTNMADGVRRSKWGSAKVRVLFLFFGLCVILGLFLSNES